VLAFHGFITSAVHAEPVAACLCHVYFYPPLQFCTLRQAQGERLVELVLELAVIAAI
jgi:hypothetical protein